MKTYRYSVVGQVSLQALWAVGLTCALMGSLDFNLKTFIDLRTR
jgi:hypothetical protein